MIHLDLDLSSRLPGLLRAAAMVALAFTPGIACKAKEGEVCRCASDCRDTLICVIEESYALEPGDCAVEYKIGYCVEDNSLEEESGGLWDMPIYSDLPSKRDLGDERRRWCR
jgi:hypothetical protein